jgi:hypothetical protein
MAESSRSKRRNAAMSPLKERVESDAPMAKVL